MSVVVIATNSLAGSSVRGALWAADQDNTRLTAHGIEVHRNPIRAPNLQAYIERWIQSIQTECLDHFVALGERHLNYLVSR